MTKGNDDWEAIGCVDLKTSIMEMSRQDITRNVFNYVIVTVYVTVGNETILQFDEKVTLIQFRTKIFSNTFKLDHFFEPDCIVF